MKKVLCALPSLSMISALLLPACATTNVSQISEDGTKMTLDEFENYFYKGTVFDQQSFANTASPSLTLSGVYYDADTRSLGVVGSVRSGQGSSKSFSLSGILYNSYKKLDGINSMTAILDDSLNNFEVLLCNIFHSTEPSPFLFNSGKTNTPHLKLYLMDKATGELYFFEPDIPQELSNVSIPQSNDTLCPDMLHDMIWFGDLIQPEIEFVENAAGNEEIMPLDTSGTTSLNQISISWSPAGGPYRYFTTPILKYSVDDIKGSNSAMWDFYFGTSNGYCLAADGNRYNITAIAIKDFQLTVEAGTNTYILPSSVISCNLLGSSSNQATQASSLFSLVIDVLKISDKIPGVSIISQILSLTNTTRSSYNLVRSAPISNSSNAMYAGFSAKIKNSYQYIQHDFNNGNGEYMFLHCLAAKIPDHITYTGAAGVNVNVRYTAELGTHSITSPGETPRIIYYLK